MWKKASAVGNIVHGLHMEAQREQQAGVQGACMHVQVPWAVQKGLHACSGSGALQRAAQRVCVESASAHCTTRVHLAARA